MRKNIVANLAGRVVTSGLRAVLLPLYLHILGVETYGLVGVYVTLRNLVAIFDFGIGAAFIREVARLSDVADSARARRELMHTLELVYWGVALAAGLTIVALAPFIATRWLHPQHLTARDVTLGIRLMGIAVCFAFPVPLYQGGLYGLQRQTLANALAVGTGIFQDGGALLAILAVPTIGAFMSWHLASGIVAVMVAALVLRRAIPAVPGVRRFSREAWTNSYRFGAGWFGHSAGSAIVTQADKVLVTRFIPLGAFGYYSIAQSLATFLMTLISPVQVAAFPRLAQLVGAGERAAVEQEYERASEYMALLLFPSAAVLIAFAPAVLLAWTRKSDVAANSSALLQIFVVGACCAGVAAILTTVQGAFGWLRVMVTTSLTAAALAFPLTYLGVTTLGARGAAIAWTILNSALLITAPFAHRKLGLGPVGRWFGASVILPAAASAAVAFLGRLLVPALEPRSFLFIVSLAVVWLCCCAAAALVLPHVRASVRELHLRLRPT